MGAGGGVWRFQGDGGVGVDGRGRRLRGGFGRRRGEPGRLGRFFLDSHGGVKRLVFRLVEDAVLVRVVGREMFHHGVREDEHQFLEDDAAVLVVVHVGEGLLVVLGAGQGDEKQAQGKQQGCLFHGLSFLKPMREGPG